MTVDERRLDTTFWRMIVVYGHTRNIDKTQLVCDVIQAFPKVNWIVGKITLHDRGLSSPTEQSCVFEWETHRDSATDSARYLAAGATRSFWLRLKQDSLDACMPVLSQALRDLPADAGSVTRKTALILESNSLLQFLKPSLFFAMVDPDREDFKDSAQTALAKANALILRGAAHDMDAPPSPLWMKVPAKLLQERPSVLQKPGEPLPRPLESLIHQMLDDAPSVEF